MALVLIDRTQQSGTANTTVSFTLSGAVTGFQSFAGIGNGNTTYYTATDVSGNWEAGIGTYSTTGPTLTRTTILSSSNAGAAVTFSGAVNVFVTYPSEKAVWIDASGNTSALGTIASGTWQGTTVGTAYGGTGVTSSSGVNSVVLRDASANININNYTANALITTAAAGTTILTVASARNQILVGATTQIFQLPNATTLALGHSFVFINNSSGVLTVKDNASTTVETIPSGGATQLGAVSIATSAGSWGPYSFIPAAVDWGTNTLNLASTIISGGTWQGGTIASGYGGTGLTTFTAANNALYSTSAGALAAGTLPVLAGGTGVTTSTGSGNNVLSTSPTLVTPILGTPSSGTVTNLTGTASININGTVGATTPTTGSFTSINTANTFGFKNRLINGFLGIDQRNAGASQSIGLTAVYTVDRWYALSVGIATTGQRIAGSNGFQYSYQITGAVANTGTTFGQKIESYNCYDLASTTVKLSAYIKASALTTVTWTAYYPTAIDNYTARTQISTGTFTINTTSTQYSVNISLPANAVNGLQIEFTTAALASGTIVYTGVQLEKGSTATSFDYRPYGTELSLCQRYFFNFNGVYQATLISGTAVTGYIYPVTMRITPTLTSGAAGFVCASPSNTGAYAIYCTTTGAYSLTASAEL